MTKLTWKDIERITTELGVKIQSSGFRPDYVIGITSGGLIPLYFLVKQLDINNILTITAKSYENNKQKELKITYLPEIDLKDKSVLLVDEITDTGTTLSAIADLVRNKYQVKELRSATLAVNTDHCNHYPDYYVIKETGDWIIFPWENEKEFKEYSG